MPVLDLEWNRHTGIHQRAPLLDLRLADALGIGVHADHGDFGDPVRGGQCSRGFEIDERERGGE